MTELEIFRNPEWLIGFLVISLVDSFARIAVGFKYSPKDFTLKKAKQNTVNGIKL